MSNEKLLLDSLTKLENCPKCGNPWYFVLSKEKQVCSMCKEERKSTPTAEDVSDTERRDEEG